MKKIVLTNVGKGQLSSLDVVNPVVSIRDKYSWGAAVPGTPNRRVLHLCFFAIDHMPSVADQDKLSKDNVRDIINLIKLSADEGKEKIYFQCSEGRIRSYTLATMLANIHSFTDEGILSLKDITVRYSNKDSLIKKGITDEKTAALIEQYVEELNKEHQESCVNV